MAEKILVVDDEEGICRVLQVSLSEAGYSVLTANHGSDALDIVRSEKPSIVLADITMPGMDGITLLQKIKEESPETEVIMMTGHADLGFAIKCLQSEAADFIMKPVNYNALEIALKRAEERIWMRAQLREYTESLERIVSEKTQKLLEAERLAAVGQTVATLAHAVKNIIGGLTGGMYVLERGIELDEKKYLLQGWEMVKGNVDKIKNLALDLLNYSKEREPDYDLCDPNIPVREACHLMAARAGEKNVSLKLELAEDMGLVVIDPEGIYCCLLNLITNAIDACENGICTDGEKEVTVRSRKVDGWAVEYQVQDNGFGMDDETRRKVFRGFFSTKGSRGTGLGLMITEKIIREHGGTLNLESSLGQGSKFTIRLPEKDVALSKYQPKDDACEDDVLK